MACSNCAWVIFLFSGDRFGSTLFLNIFQYKLFSVLLFFIISLWASVNLNHSLVYFIPNHIIQNILYILFSISKILFHSFLATNAQSWYHKLSILIILYLWSSDVLGIDTQFGTITLTSKSNSFRLDTFNRGNLSVFSKFSIHFQYASCLLLVNTTVHLFRSNQLIQNLWYNAFVIAEFINHNELNPDNISATSHFTSGRFFSFSLFNWLATFKLFGINQDTILYAILADLSFQFSSANLSYIASFTFFGAYWTIIWNASLSFASRTINASIIACSFVFQTINTWYGSFSIASCCGDLKAIIVQSVWVNTHVFFESSSRTFINIHNGSRLAIHWYFFLRYVTSHS